MDKPDLLWINLTVSLKEAELPVGFQDYFDIRCCANTLDLDTTVNRRPPQVLCFDFDYPDRAGLRLLLDTKRTHPSLPILENNLAVTRHACATLNPRTPLSV